ncbi:MAG: NAD(P)-dependent oxidoreductase [Bacteriovoracaceae bacterium]|nr:NAD(P)-dependent oxidoreductase [Bacteriovoracaceae bacterium]
MQKNETNPGPKRLLLTGGTGYLGSAIASDFLESSWEVHVLKRSSSSLSKLPVEHAFLKFHSIEEFEAGKYDAFIHAATAYGRKGESPEDIEKANVNFPLSILRKIDLSELHFVNIGTSLPKELNDYSRTKNEFIEKVKTDFKDLKMTNLILEQFFGPKDGTFINFIIDKLKKNEDVELTEGMQFRDFIYFKDVISAIKFTIDKELIGDFPLGLSQARTIRSVVEEIKMELGKTEAKLCFGAVPYRENELMRSEANIDKLKDAGWKPRWSFEEGLRETIRNS